MLFRVAEMQSFAAAGNNKFTCKGKSWQSIIQMIPSLRAVQTPNLEGSAKSSIQEEPCLGRAAVTASKAVRPLQGPGLQNPGALCYTIPLLEKQHFEALIWLSENFLKILKFSHILEERHFNLIKWTLLKTSCCICP